MKTSFAPSRWSRVVTPDHWAGPICIGLRPQNQIGSEVFLRAGRGGETAKLSGQPWAPPGAVLRRTPSPSWGATAPPWWTPASITRGPFSSPGSDVLPLIVHDLATAVFLYPPRFWYVEAYMLEVVPIGSFSWLNCSAADGELRLWDAIQHRVLSSTWCVSVFRLLPPFCRCCGWRGNFFFSWILGKCRAHGGVSGVYSVATGPSIGDRVLRCALKNYPRLCCDLFPAYEVIRSVIARSWLIHIMVL